MVGGIERHVEQVAEEMLQLSVKINWDDIGRRECINWCHVAELWEICKKY